MSEVNIFEQATRKQVRFETTKGVLTTEDLWSMNLNSLDKIAVALKKELDNVQESFIKKDVQKTAEQLKFDIVLHIINTKMREQEERERAAQVSLQREKIKELIASKQNQALEQKSIDELMAELDKLN